MRLGAMKIIFGAAPEGIEMYDVAKDPGELENLSPTRSRPFSPFGPGG